MNERHLEGFRIDNVRESGDNRLIDKAIELWLSERALSEVEARRRAGQLLLVATCENTGRVAGVTTTYLKDHPVLRLPLWNMRAFVAHEFRQHDVGYHMLFATREYHEKQFVSGNDTRGRGLYMEIENPVIKKYRNQAVWPRSRLVFIGLNRRGDHCRVSYFEGARID